MSDSLRVLVVTTDPPTQPISGYSIRNHHLVKRLAIKHRVWVLTYGTTAARGGPLRDAGVELHSVPWIPPLSKRLKQLASIFTTSSHLGGIYHTQAMQMEINRIMAEVAFDVVLVEGCLLTRFDFGATTPVVLDEHNIEYNLLRRTCLLEPSWPRKAFGYVEYRKFKREEKAACRRAAWCTFTSDLERELIEQNVHLMGSTVIPNGVDLEYFEPYQLPESRGIVFTGRLDYRPNADAVLFFVHDVLPSIRRSQPEVVVTVVGGGAPPEIGRLTRHGIIVTGPVPDVRPYLGNASVVVAPIRLGAGTRLKVLEALAMARPLVSTAIGCEGLDVVSGQHLLVADSAQDFADAVVRLLESPDLAAAFGRSGRRLVEQRYGWDLSGGLMQSVLEQVSSRRCATRPAARGHHTAEPDALRA